ncbi:somatostatin receptor type 2-like [Antedon mediterranea]|uniref:somatostatin receptor type 2-like n=1 Tax=Antedon mediterranea TaxID=105859 RepID=UPI003AF7F8B6
MNKSTFYTDSNIVNESTTDVIGKVEETDWDDVIKSYSYTTTDEIVITIFMPIVVIIGIIGNLMTITVIVKHPRMRTSVNVYLANLAIADVLFLCFAPDLIWSSFAHSPLHDVFDMGIGEGMLWFCHLNIYIVDTALQVANFTIFWMSAERYLAICHPLKFRNSKFGERSRSLQVCVIMWLISLTWQARKFTWNAIVSYEFPWPDMYNGAPNSTIVCTYCGANTDSCDFQNDLFVIDSYLSFILITIVVGFYTIILITLKRSTVATANSTGNKVRSKSEKKVFMTIFLTVTIYIFCMAPFSIMNIVNIYHGIDHNVILQIVNIFRVALYTNSSVNPFMYNVVNEMFRKAFVDVFCRRRNSKKTSGVTVVSQTNPAYVNG